MQEYFQNKKKASAIVYALIIAATSGLLIIVVSLMVLIGTVTSNQTTDGIQAYYSSESAKEIAYSARRYLNVKVFPSSSDFQTTDVSRAIININQLTNTLTFTTVDSSTNRAKRNSEITTMDFKIYSSLGASEPIPYPTPSSRFNYVLMTDGYYGASQSNLKAFIGEPDDLYLPYVTTSSF